MLSAHQLPYFNLELMREESAERQQSVRNTPGKETRAGAYTTPETKPTGLCAHGLLLLYIAVCVVHLWAAAIVVFKGPVQH